MGLSFFRPPAVSLIAALVGCSGVYTTVQLPPERDDRILGEWVGNEDDHATITESGDGYLLASAPDKDEDPIQFTLSRVGGRTYLQSPVEDCAGFDPGEKRCYHIVLMRLEGDRMDLDWLNAERLAADSFSGKLTIPHELRRKVRAKDRGSVSNEILLFGTQQELEALLETYASDASALEELSRLRRPD